MLSLLLLSLFVCFGLNLIPSLETCDIKPLPLIYFFLALLHGLSNFVSAISNNKKRLLVDQFKQNS